MRTSIDFKILRRIILATLIIPFAANADAQEGVLQFEVERTIDIEVLIEPQIISLARAPVELEGQSDGVASAGGALDIVITPDHKIEEKAAAGCTGGLFCAFEKATTAVEGVATEIEKSTLEPEIVAVFAGINAGTLEEAKQLHGDDTTMNVSFRNDPEAAAALAEAGYEDVGLHGLNYEGETFRMTRWSKYGGAGGGPETGTATSHINIQSDANIDYESVAFRGAFVAPEDISFDLETTSVEATRSETLANQFEEYKAAVRSRLSEVMAHLNEPRNLLNDDEMVALYNAKVGETIPFSKRINFEWFGEQKTVNVDIAATVRSDAPSADLDDPLRFFEDAENWFLPPDAEDDATPLPPTDLEVETRQ